MLALTHTGPRGLQGFGATAETHLVLGVPFKFKYGIGTPPYNINIYVAEEPLTVDIPKTRLPAQLAAAVNQLIAQRAQQALQNKPELATNPTALLDEAKRLAKLTGGSTSAASFIDPLTWAHVGRFNKVNNKDSLDYLVLAKDTGSAIRVRLHHVKHSSSIPGFSQLKSFAVTLAKGASTTVNFVKGGIEGAFELVKQAFKMLCQVADSEIVKLAQGYVGAQAEVGNLAVAFKAGDKATMTKIVTDVYASGSATKIAAVNSALTKLQTLCGGPSMTTPDTASVKRRWPMVVATVGGVALVGTVGIMAAMKLSRRR